MALRVTVDEVAAILPADNQPANLVPFIDTANLLVDEDLAGKGLSAARLKEIEKYLAAHFATVTSGEIKWRKVGDATDEYVKATMAAGLKGTTFGQQAISLDTSNTLLGTGKSSASFEMLT